MKTIGDQIVCLRREIAMRKNVYPKWVDSKRMKQEAATHEIETMQAAHDTVTLHPELVFACRVALQCVPPLSKAESTLEAVLAKVPA